MQIGLKTAETHDLLRQDPDIQKDRTIRKLVQAKSAYVVSLRELCSAELLAGSDTEALEKLVKRCGDLGRELKPEIDLLYQKIALINAVLSLLSPTQGVAHYEDLIKETL